MKSPRPRLTCDISGCDEIAPFLVTFTTHRMSFKYCYAHYMQKRKEPSYWKGELRFSSKNPLKSDGLTLYEVLTTLHISRTDSLNKDWINLIFMDRNGPPLSMGVGIRRSLGAKEVWKTLRQMNLIV